MYSLGFTPWLFHGKSDPTREQFHRSTNRIIFVLPPANQHIHYNASLHLFSTTDVKDYHTCVSFMRQRFTKKTLNYLIWIIHCCFKEWLRLYLQRLVILVDVLFHNVDVAVVDVAAAAAAVAVDAATWTIDTDIPIIDVVHRAVVQIDGNILTVAGTWFPEGFLDSLGNFFCLFLMIYIVRHLKPKEINV